MEFMEYDCELGFYLTDRILLDYLGTRFYFTMFWGHQPTVVKKTITMDISTMNIVHEPQQSQVLDRDFATYALAIGLYIYGSKAY